MQIRFQLNFASSYGQELSVNIKHITENGKVIERETSLQFISDSCWVGVYEFSSKDNSGTVQYLYRLFEGGNCVSIDQWKERVFHLNPQSAKIPVLIDSWEHQPIESAVFQCKAFKDVILKKIGRAHV